MLTKILLIIAVEMCSYKAVSWGWVQFDIEAETEFELLRPLPLSEVSGPIIGILSTTENYFPDVDVSKTFVLRREHGSVSLGLKLCGRWIHGVHPSSRIRIACCPAIDTLAGDVPVEQFSQTEC